MGNIVKKYLNHCKMIGLSEETIEAKKYDLKNFDFEKIKCLEDIYDFVENSRPTPTGKWRMLINIKMFYKWYAEDHETPINYLKITIPKKIDPPQHYVTEGEFELIDQECHNLMNDRRWVRAHAVLHLLWETGIRRGELLKIRREDFDLPGKTFLVENEKTHHTKRCFFSTDISDYVNKYHPRPQLFDISKRQLCGIIETLRKKAKIEKKITCHSFRHGFCTRILNNGLDIQTTATLLGHQKLSTTMRYWHTSEPELRSKYDQFLSAPKTYEFSTKIGRAQKYKLELRITKNKHSGK